jgi:uracil-DNA glycosylase
LQILDNVDPLWREILDDSLSSLSPKYLEFLQNDDTYFPDINNFLNAFKTLPLDKTKYILFGQDPYPRQESAIGYAFIDGKVKSIFSENGLSKEVNKATSLRNFIKMAFVCKDELKDDFSKEAVAKIDKTPYIKSIHELKENFEKNGVLLLNMALVFTAKEDSKKHVKEWNSFVKKLLFNLQNRDIELILFGKMAEVLEKLEETKSFKKHTMPHPYNIGFITDKNAHRLFKPMNLLLHSQ